MVPETPPALASRFCLLTAGFTLPIAVAAPQASVTRTYRSHGERNSLQITRVFCELSPRSTGLGSVEATGPYGRGEGRRPGHPGLRAWAPLKRLGLTLLLRGGGCHPGLRAWAPLKHEEALLADLDLLDVTQVYGPGLR